LSPDTRAAVLVSVGLHLALLAAALLIVMPAYQKQPRDERNVRLMQIRTGFPNAQPGDVFRGRGNPQGQDTPPRSVSREVALDSGVRDYEPRPHTMRGSEEAPHILDDEKAIMPAATQTETSGGRTSTAQAQSPAGDDYLNRLQQRIAQRGTGQDAGGRAVQGEVLVYDQSQAEVARGVRRRVIPDYPANEQLAGVVHVRVDITADGRVENAMVVQKLAPAFDTASLNAARAWEFEPAPATAHHYAVIKFRYVLK